MAGGDGESAELQGRLGISHSPEAGCHTQTLGTASPVRAAPSLGEMGPQEEEGELPWAKSWGRKRQEEGTVRFTNCMGSVGGGNLVVNRNRWASSQEKRWKKKTSLSLGGWWE